mmetsp:Transcript_73654/g.159366  ORF Transcript_73654/g.159366 Transcript_73654/m.159366 type:complete len:200 (-) Transcript_73654:748-1347(-)
MPPSPVHGGQLPLARSCSSFSAADSAWSHGPSDFFQTTILASLSCGGSTHVPRFRGFTFSSLAMRRSAHSVSESRPPGEGPSEAISLLPRLSLHSLFILLLRSSSSSACACKAPAPRASAKGIVAVACPARQREGVHAQSHMAMYSVVRPSTDARDQPTRGRGAPPGRRPAVTSRSMLGKSLKPRPPRRTTASSTVSAL